MPHVQSSSPHTIIRCGPPLSMHARERASMADWLYVDLNPFTTSFFEGRGEEGGSRAPRRPDVFGGNEVHGGHAVRTGWPRCACGYIKPRCPIDGKLAHAA